MEKNGRDRQSDSADLDKDEDEDKDQWWFLYQGIVSSAIADRRNIVTTGIKKALAGKFDE